MIEINLLKKRQEVFLQRVLIFRIIFIYLIGFLFLLVIIGISYFSNRIAIKLTLTSIENYKQKIKNEKGIIQNLERYNAEMDRIARDLFFIQEEYKKRVLWSKKFAIIVSSIPDSIYLEKISLDPEKNFVIEGSVSPEIKNIKKLITEFMNNLRANSASEFSNISLAEIKKITKTPKQDTTTFKINCTVKGNK